MSATYIQSKFMKRFTVKLGRMEMIRYYQNTPQHGLFLQYPPHTSLPFSLSKVRHSISLVRLNVLNAELSAKRYRRRTEIPGVWGRGRLCLTPHCHHQNVSCMKVASGGSHFNASLYCEGQSHMDSVHRPQLLKTKGEPKRNRTEVLLITSLTPYR